MSVAWAITYSPRLFAASSAQNMSLMLPDRKEQPLHLVESRCTATFVTEIPSQYKLEHGVTKRIRSEKAKHTDTCTARTRASTHHPPDSKKTLKLHHWHPLKQSAVPQRDMATFGPCFRNMLSSDSTLVALNSTTRRIQPCRV